ncbi:MAG: ATP-binding protein [Pseudomonadota bacterium]
MNSISVRLLLAAGLVMALFIGFSTLAIIHTVDQRAEQARFERMQGQIYGMLGVTRFNDAGSIDIPAIDLPNNLLRQPMSGNYAEIRDMLINQVWRSPSLTTELPASGEGAIGQWRFTTENDPRMGKLFILRFAVEWLLPEGDVQVYQFVVADNRVDFDKQRQLFNRNLWLAMIGMGVLLLSCIAIALAWGLRPLRRMSQQLNEIENGQREQLPSAVPRELHPVASRLNALIASERGRRQKYRNTLDDLAHSLKTPLSVLRNLKAYEGNDRELQRQADRMQQIVDYHIKRADAGAQRLLTPPITIAEPLAKITRSLGKVFHRQHVEFINRIDDQQTVRMEEGDLMEILGNLLENACKYGANRIALTAADADDKARIVIEDNGPGFPEHLLAHLTNRGVRADTQREGQGLGLAICRELIESYGGTLQLANKSRGGARITITLPSGNKRRSRLSMQP